MLPKSSIEYRHVRALMEPGHDWILAFPPPIRRKQALLGLHGMLTLSVPKFAVPPVSTPLKTSPDAPSSQAFFSGVGLANEFKQGGLCQFVIPSALVNRPRLTGVTLPRRKSNIDTSGASRKSIDSSRKTIGLNVQFDSLRSNNDTRPYVGMMRQHSYEGFEAIGSPNSPKHATPGVTLPSAMDLLDTYARSRPTSPASQSVTP